MTQNDHINVQFAPYLNTMEDSPLKAYIVGRVINQINWYDKKSKTAERQFKCCTIVAIILNAIIPIVVLFSDYCIHAKLLIAAISSSASTLAAIVTFCNCHDLWIQYRSNCELLKSTLHRFFVRAAEFKHVADNEKDLMNALVTACEEYLTKEFQSWVVVSTGEKQSAAIKV